MHRRHHAWPITFLALAAMVPPAAKSAADDPAPALISEVDPID